MTFLKLFIHYLYSDTIKDEENIMSIEIEKLTERDIRKFKREIEGYEKSKKVFLILGFVFMVLTILLLAVAIMFGIFAGFAGKEINDYFSFQYFYLYLSLCVTSASFASTIFLVTILMFILRAVLFQKKTENRLNAIEDYEEYQASLKKLPNNEVETASKVVEDKK